MTRAVPGTDLPDSVMAFCSSPQHFILDIALNRTDKRFRVNDETFLVLTDPSSIHEVLTGRPEDFEKGAMVEIPRTTLGDGLITVEMEGWREQRDMFAPMFARRYIRALEPLIAERVKRQVDEWAALPDDAHVDILSSANRLAFDVVATGLLGIADTSLADDLFEALHVIDQVEIIRVHYLVKRNAGDRPVGYGRSAHAQALERKERLTREIADRRLALDHQPDDMLGAAINSPAFAAFPPERQRTFLADQIVTMLAAGYMTTGESIFWALYMLAKNPAAQAQAYAEVAAETDAMRGAAPIDAPRWVAACIDESQRLYPAIWWLGRVARRDVRAGDIDIPAGTRVICSPWVLQRMPTLWTDSEQYRPERFLPGATPAVTPRTLIPFGGGMRMCLGRGLARMEMSAIVCATLARFELELVSDPPVRLAAAFSMHPRERILFRLKPRA